MNEEYEFESEMRCGDYLITLRDKLEPPSAGEYGLNHLGFLVRGENQVTGEKVSEFLPAHDAEAALEHVRRRFGCGNILGGMTASTSIDSVRLMTR